MAVELSLKKGLDLPFRGEPAQTVSAGPPVSRVAVLGGDYHGLKPAMQVQVGDSVGLGQPLFTDKRYPEVRYTAPGAGRVVDIRRGTRRALQAVIIELDGDAEQTFASYADAELAALPGEAVRENLLQSGLWTALRTRPYSKVPDPHSSPAALFVTAVDTRPLAPDPAPLIEAAAEDFRAGLNVLTALTDGPLHVCTAAGVTPPLPQHERIRHAAFSGPHPSGLPGTHIHLLQPVSATRTVWYLGYQDVIAIGRLFRGGRLDPTRVVSLAGPLVHQPRLITARLGASTEDLVREQASDVQARVISGSPLGGHRATDWGAYLGRYHQQVCVLGEGGQREFLGWLWPWGEKYSLTRAFTSALRSGARYAFNTSANGSPRAMVPIGVYEKVMPLDLLPTPLLRALLVRDTDLAQRLGCLELDEEDLALCTYVCPSKYEYGPVLRANLEVIEKEG